MMRSLNDGRMAPSISDISVGPYRGCISKDYLASDLLSRLSDLSTLIPRAAGTAAPSARSRIVKLAVLRDGSPLELAVKVFSRQSLLKDAADHSRGSKARRSWLVARALQERGIGTPTPVGFLDRWHGGRLAESYLLTVFSRNATSFRDELIRLYTEDPHCWKMMALLECVAKEVRLIHDAGIVHGDLGNQNVLLERTGDGEWGNVQVVDLNRGRVREQLGVRERAFDVSRVSLPSDFLRVFKEMYWEKVPPAGFQRWEVWYRRMFVLHTRTRSLRHPVRTWRQRVRVKEHRAEGERWEYPAERDIWIWDERSGQAISPMKSKDRRRHHSLWRDPRLVSSTLSSAIPVYLKYRKLKSSYYKSPVVMKDRVGVTMSTAPEGMDQRMALLDDLGKMPVMIRFYRHEGEKQWSVSADLVKRLHATGRSVSVALVQDRRAVTKLAEWKSFVEQVVSAVVGTVEWIEVGHAINRAKWGIWNFDEYCEMLDVMRGIKEAHPDARFIGPAVIDFECPVAVTALRLAAPRLKFDALAHHLYVDRRGAPENTQGGFALVDKLALLRAIADRSSGCDNGVIVSETNWPLEGTGVHSPVGSPYVSPGERRNDPSVSEQDYSDYMIRYLLQAICSGMAERVYWWRLVAHGFGLVDDADSGGWRRRAAFDALRFLLATLGDATFEEKLHSPSGADLLKFRVGNGADMVVAYSTVGAISVEIPIPFSRALNCRGEEVKAVGESVELSGSPVYLM